MMSFQHRLMLDAPSTTPTCSSNPLQSSSPTTSAINTGFHNMITTYIWDTSRVLSKSHDEKITTSSEHISSTSTELTDVCQQQQLDYHPLSSHRDPSNSATQVTTGKMTAPFQQGFQETSNTLTISQDILKDPVKVLYLFQCFQEAQDDKLSDILSKSFDSGKINLSTNSLLLHQVVSLGFFLSRSHRKWKELNLECCLIRDHGINLLHHYLCGDKRDKQEITTIDLRMNLLTVASSPLIGDIITDLQPYTLKLSYNIVGVKDISAAVININSIKVLHMERIGLTAQEASAISDMMTCLEELCINHNELGNDGAIIISEGLTKTSTLRVLDISYNNITTTGATAIANSLLHHNTSLEALSMDYSDGATSITQATLKNKGTLKKLVLLRGENDEHTSCIESATIITSSQNCNC